jgi:COP9 signalosome complex subunit 1
VRAKALVQFFSPYLSVDMRKMAAEFSTDLGALEAEVADLIDAGRIKGRIDADRAVLFARHADERVATYRAALAAGQNFETHARVCCRECCLFCC